MSDLISRKSAIDALKVAYWDENIQSAKDDPCIVDAMTDWAIRQVKDLPPAEPRWIPVAERLPLYGQDVLAVRTYGDGEKCQEVLMAHIAVWNEETGAKWWNATNITHWMPLPEPPKGERKDDGDNH